MKKYIYLLSAILIFSFSVNAQNGNANPNGQWRINGNSASTSDFIGTTNSQSLIFKTNNIERLKLDGQGKLLFNSGKEMIINEPGLIRMENTNPISAYMLKVGGSGHFEGEVNTRQLFVQEYITFLKSMKGPRIDIDTIRMDSTRGIYGHTKIFGDVQIKQNLEVLGKATFKNNLIVEKGITFDGVNGISYSVTNGIKSFNYGRMDRIRPLPIGISCAAGPQPWANHQFGGMLQIYDIDASGEYVQNSGLLNFQTWSGGSSIDASIGGEEGPGGLLLNYFCHNSTYINTGWDFDPNHTVNGGRVIMGAEVEMARSLKIGWNGAPSIIDPKTAIEINQNTINASGVKVKTWETSIKAFAIEYGDATNPFVVYGSGDTKTKNLNVIGDATISSLIGTGTREILVDPTGKLIIATNGAVGTSWLLGGNIGNGNKLGTTDNTDLPFITNNTEKMRVDALGNILINTENSTSPYYKKTLTVNGDVCFANYNTNDPSSVHANDGFSGFEILGDGKTPTRKGISVDGDPKGNFNLFINSNQEKANFHFMNGYNGALSATNPFLVRIDGNGRTDINALNREGKYFVINNLSNIDKPQECFIISGNGRTEIHLTDKSGVENAFEVYDSRGKEINFLVKQNGYVYAREINVMPSHISFPDYVFAKNYKLMALNEVEAYININKHLPNIPTAKEVEANGINLAELQIKQMEKIEELYLHLIELKKENDTLKKRVELLEQK